MIQIPQILQSEIKQYKAIQKDSCMRTKRKHIHESHSLRFARRNAEVVDKSR